MSGADLGSSRRLTGESQSCLGVYVRLVSENTYKLLNRNLSKSAVRGVWIGRVWGARRASEVGGSTGGVEEATGRAGKGARRRGIASSGHASQSSAGLSLPTPPPLSGPHLCAQSLPCLNPRHLFPWPARAQLTGRVVYWPESSPSSRRRHQPRCPPVRASLCLRLHTTRPTQSCAERRNGRPGQGTHRGELWTLRLRTRDRAWVTRGCSLRAAPQCCLQPRPVCSSQDCPQGPLGCRSAAREPPAWKRRTCGP